MWAGQWSLVASCHTKQNDKGLRYAHARQNTLPWILFVSAPPLSRGPPLLRAHPSGPPNRRGDWGSPWWWGWCVFGCCINVYQWVPPVQECTGGGREWEWLGWSHSPRYPPGTPQDASTPVTVTTTPFLSFHSLLLVSFPPHSNTGSYIWSLIIYIRILLVRISGL